MSKCRGEDYSIENAEGIAVHPQGFDYFRDADLLSKSAPGRQLFLKPNVRPY
jgi:hypothetical protein